MRHISLTAILIFFGLFVFAQPSGQSAAEPDVPGGGRISGNIMDDKGQTLESATVALLNAGDSSRVKETVTNKAGHFVFADLPDGKYLVLASSVGFTRQYSQPVEITGKNPRSVPPMVLAGASTSLAAVAV